MKNDTTTIIVKNKDAGFIAKAIEHFQETRGIKKLDIRYGVNKLRMTFEDINQKNKKG